MATGHLLHTQKSFSKHSLTCNECSTFTEGIGRILIVIKFIICILQLPSQMGGMNLGGPSGPMPPVSKLVSHGRKNISVTNC